MHKVDENIELNEDDKDQQVKTGKKGHIVWMFQHKQ